MSNLRDIQMAFAKAIYENNVESASPFVYHQGISVAERLGVYQRNVVLSLQDVLFTKYPMVRAIVGDPFFNAAAMAYIRKFPSRSGNIDQYGGYFADFLAELASARSVPYLPDIARYEWYEELAHHGADQPINEMAIQEAFELPEDLLARCTVELHPSVFLLTSPFPIDTIIAVIRKEEPESALRSTGNHPVYLLFSRPEYQVMTDSLPAPAYEFISVLKQGGTLKTAYESAIAHDPDFDAATALVTLMDRRAMVNINRE